MVCPFSSLSDVTFESIGTTIALPLPLILPDNGAKNMLSFPAFLNAAKLLTAGKSAIAPKSKRPATISLVSGAPEVKFFH